MESDESSLPSAHAVLDKLKSEGTFDKFRKTCLAAIEEEPSFRAQKEHVEVLSRRFLQAFNIKEGKTKNEVRTKLRNFVIDEIKKPDVQVGQPIDKLIEKTLEAKGSELFHKILEIIDKMQRPSPPPLPPENPIREEQTKPPPPEPLDDRVLLSEETSGTSGPSQSYNASIGSKLEMPIDLLELSTFTNPLKRDIKKSIKNRSRTDAGTKDGGRHKTYSKNEQNERKGSLKGREKEDEIAKNSGDKNGEKELGKNDNEKRDSIVTNSDGQKCDVIVTNSDGQKCDVIVTNSDGLKCDESVEKIEETVENISSEEKESIFEPRKASDTDSASLDDETISNNITEDKPSPSENNPPVRRSARLASIEEEKKETTVATDTTTTNAKSLSSKRGRKRKQSLDTELISDDELISDEHIEKEEVASKKSNATKKLYSSKSRKRPVISSDSEDDALSQQRDRKKGKIHNDDDDDGIKSVKNSSPNNSPISSPILVSSLTKKEHADNKEGVVEETKGYRNRKRKLQ